MSKDEKERETQFDVKDRRRFTMGPDGKVIDNKKDEQPDDAATDAVEPEPKPDETQQAQPDSDAQEQAREREYQNVPMTFTTLVLSISTQAMMALGELPDPMSGEVNKNLASAKQLIDLLGVLKEKTKGNLDKDEESFLQASLTDLRIKYVEYTKK